MQWLSVATITNSSCRLGHNINIRSRIDSNNICTENSLGMATCTGDDGGALVAGNAIIGVHSWSVPCAQGSPDVYTRVSAYATWIRGVVN